MKDVTISRHHQTITTPIALGAIDENPAVMICLPEGDGRTKAVTDVVPMQTVDTLPVHPSRSLSTSYSGWVVWLFVVSKSQFGEYLEPGQWGVWERLPDIPETGFVEKPDRWIVSRKDLCGEKYISTFGVV